MADKKLQENEIRPAELMQGQQVAMTVDIGRMLVNASEFIEVNCPACEKNDSFFKFSKYGLKINECHNCGTLYTNPRPTAEILEDFYKDSVNYAFWNKHIFPASEEARRKKIFVPRVDKILEICDKYDIAKDSLIEVGAAFGTFCIELQSRNCFSKIMAIEPTPGLAATCREKGLEVIEEVIENIKFEENEKYDVVVNFEVIEHLFSPKDFILSCKGLLKKGGLLILTCPNGKGFDFTVLEDKCNSVDHEHLNYFNPASLSLLLERCGFRVLESQTPGKLDAELVRKKILSGEFDVTNHHFLKQVLLEKWDTVGQHFQQFISEAGLSSNMLIVARLKE